MCWLSFCFVCYGWTDGDSASGLESAFWTLSGIVRGDEVYLRFKREPRAFSHIKCGSADEVLFTSAVR